MMLMHIVHASGVKLQMIPDKTPLETKIELMSNAKHLSMEEIYDGDSLRIETLCEISEEPWIKMRLYIVTEMAKSMAKYVLAGVRPILIWDPIMGGKRGTPGKIHRKSEPMILRNVDKIYIYYALKNLGIPSVVAWTEGEKVACAASQSGLGVVMSGDTDCVVLGAEILGGTAIPIVGAGILLLEAIGKNDILGFFASHGVSENAAKVRLFDAAVFLGNDFCVRLRGNGPVKMAKKCMAKEYSSFITSVLQTCPDEEYVAAVRRAIDFYNITNDDRIRAKQMVEMALAEAWRPNLEMLEKLGILTMLGNCIDIVSTGSIIKMSETTTVTSTLMSGATTY
jgi:hypothetical protein